jgi:hypothetical protein
VSELSPFGSLLMFCWRCKSRSGKSPKSLIYAAVAFVIALSTNSATHGKRDELYYLYCFTGIRVFDENFLGGIRAR